MFIHVWFSEGSYKMEPQGVYGVEIENVFEEKYFYSVMNETTRETPARNLLLAFAFPFDERFSSADILVLLQIISRKDWEIMLMKKTVEIQHSLPSFNLFFSHSQKCLICLFISYQRLVAFYLEFKGNWVLW